MPQIICNDKNTKKVLSDIQQTILDNGGWLHNHLTTTNDENGLSLFINGPTKPTENIIKIPKHLLIVAEQADFSLKGDSLQCNPDTKMLSQEQIKLTELITELYNLTDKIKWHKQTCPWLALRPHKDIAKKLFSSRTLAKQRQKYFDYLLGNESTTKEDDFICESYIKTRVLGQKSKEEDTPVSTIMPIVDYMNHNVNGASFALRVYHDTGQEELRIGGSQPFVYSKECYAFYNLMDSLDSYMNYYFIDQDVNFVRSKEMKISLDDIGELTIKANSGVMKHKALPKNLEDLKRLMPRVGRDDDDNITISHLPITVQTMPHATRRILFSVLSALAQNKLSQKQLFKATYETEEKILKDNISFYKDILNDLSKYKKQADIKALSNVKEICDIQLSKLYKYHFDDKYFERQFNKNIGKISPE